ncbi:proton-conducting transporter membrane subunit [Sulfoacidibacillus thermotolerans]|uniref:NADH:quinone oxidoreductase/Mrp antiporter transmembrane domain-containing protein n=1 Tax=Sulfoacidibacillus thermotolerans TaxID=1765684 RepID=A0A2U3D817_SULT2|nr:proton-conducting transporter membrane subunit [Sulfoacidibacillus thermotolerans]PWI57420.1 hypothetical protein BM613_08840 [Sulfoacidibacillus thermotolerans]
MQRIVHVSINLATVAFSVGILFLGWSGLEHPTLLFAHPLFSDIFSTSFFTLNLATVPLSSVFLMTLGVLGVLSAIYGIGYGEVYRARFEGAWLDVGVFLFIAAMAVVFLAGNAFTFLFGWEMMSFVSYLLVVYESERPEVNMAGVLYLAMTQIGTVFLILAFYLLHQFTGSYDFAVFVHLARTLSPVLQSVIFLFTFVGFALKAGIMPLHIWLPRAHPAAPSHVSALMSGIMLKTALYGLLLVNLYWLSPTVWWGVLFIVLGGSSAVLGAFHATQETDIKRILAYSSIENMGLLFMVVGISIAAFALREWTIAGVALCATIYQAMNHAAFKSLLFHAAGSMIHGTHERSLNFLGGLLRRMPYTSIAMAVGLLSVAAVPPFNGFMSEWLVFLASADLARTNLHNVVGLFAAIALFALLFTGALVALMAARIFGVGFQGEGRSPGARAAHEAPFAMRLSLLMGALYALLLGLFPAFIVNALQLTLPEPLRFSPVHLWYTGNLFAISKLPFILLFLLVGGGFFVFLLLRLFIGKEQRHIAPTWTCGGERMAFMSYSATGFSQPVARTFRSLMIPVARGYMYRPAWDFVLKTAQYFRRIQNGSVRSYLVYLFVTVIVLLIVVR